MAPGAEREAIFACRAAFAAEPRSAILLRIGALYLALDRPSLALEYASLVSAAQASSTSERAEAEALAERVTPRTGGLRVVLPPPPAVCPNVLVDGAPATSRFDPGEHLVRVECFGRVPFEQTVQIRADATTRVVVEGPVPSADSVAPTEPLRAGQMLEDMLERPVDIEVTASHPRWLFARRVERSGMLTGTLQRVCLAPCTTHIGSGRYALGISANEAGPPEHVLWEAPLRESALIRIEVRDRHLERDVMTVLDAVLGASAVGLIAVGALTWFQLDVGPPLVGVGGLLALGLVFGTFAAFDPGDDAEIHVTASSRPQP